MATSVERRRKRSASAERIKNAYNGKVFRIGNKWTHKKPI